MNHSWKRTSLSPPFPPLTCSRPAGHIHQSFRAQSLSQLPHLGPLQGSLVQMPQDPASEAYSPPLASQGRCSIPINPQALIHATLGRCCCVCPIRPSTGTTKGRGTSKDLGEKILVFPYSLIRTQSKKNPNP